MSTASTQSCLTYTFASNIAGSLTSPSASTSTSCCNGAVSRSVTLSTATSYAANDLLQTALADSMSCRLFTSNFYAVTLPTLSNPYYYCLAASTL